MTHRIATTKEHGFFNAFWRAWSDSLGADSSPYGQGNTEAEAIDDLQWQLADLEGVK